MNESETIVCYLRFDFSIKLQIQNVPFHSIQFTRTHTQHSTANSINLINAQYNNPNQTDSFNRLQTTFYVLAYGNLHFIHFLRFIVIIFIENILFTPFDMQFWKTPSCNAFDYTKRDSRDFNWNFTPMKHLAYR